jgi:hypothetical protein
MPPKNNPLKLNPLQLRTLALFQEIARHPQLATRDAATGEAAISHIPHPHGDHFHVGGQLVMARDATGLSNPAVWAALERKGLAYGEFPYSVTLTVAGLAYETGVESEIFHGSDH